MSVNLEDARIVVLDILERSGDMAEDLERRLYEDFAQAGGSVPPPDHEMRAEFEAWAEDAGCRVAGKIRAPMLTTAVADRARPLFRIDPDGRWVDDPCPNGRGKHERHRWTGAVTWLDGGYSGAGGQINDDWRSWLDRTAGDIRLLKDLRWFAGNLPCDQELLDGWTPPDFIVLEQHEAAILAGEDPETGLPAEVAKWLSNLVYEPKRNYAAAYCAHRLYGDPEPVDPGADWAPKARKRADRVLAVVS